VSKVKGLDRTGGEGHRPIGEIGLSMMGQTKKPTKGWKVRDMPISCKRCGYTARFSAASLAALMRAGGLKSRHNDWVCQECKKKDDLEIVRAINAVEARKQALKKGKKP